MSKNVFTSLHKRVPSAEAWALARVSASSCFGDDLWQLDIAVAGRSSYDKRLNWNVALADGSRLTDPQHARLLNAAKQFLWSMANDPPPGRKRVSPSSLFTKGQNLIVILRWMIAEGYTSFAELDGSAIERLRAWLRTRQVAGTDRPITPIRIANHLQALKDLYRQRSKVADAPRHDPLPMETTFEAAGVTPANKGWIPFIPDAIAIDILNKALDWVTDHPEPILAARETWHAAFEASRAAGNDRPRYCAHVALKRKNLKGPKGEAIDGARMMRRLVMHLTDACFIVIAGFVGMRVSEILSMEVGCIERRLIGDTGLAQAYVVARMFKTVDDPRGRVERWLAPGPVVRAVEILERLSLPLREASKRRELFLVKNQQGDIVPITTFNIRLRICKFADYVGVPHHEGKPWPFSPHQFRKTFARFIARRDRSQLMALADHFKHASIAMTARGYVGNHFDLKELIDHEGEVETARALECLLTSDRLAGRMGERIVAENAAFRGRAGEQVRGDYIAFVLTETDLRVHACDYGWCVFQAETARCGGASGPNEAERSPSTCLGCTNFVVDARHRDYWQDRRERNEALLDEASAPTRAVLDQAIGECNRVLALIGEEDNGRQER
jgi:integrase